MAIVLGISIGTRNVGLAVIRLRRLTDYRIRTFGGKWTPEKCATVLSVIEIALVRNGITDVTIKIPDAAHCSENIEELLRGIDTLGEGYKIKIHKCTIKQIKLQYVNENLRNKRQIIAALIERYPELQREWRGNSKSQKYKTKLFEAIACADQALRTK